MTSAPKPPVPDSAVPEWCGECNETGFVKCTTCDGQCWIDRHNYSTHCPCWNGEEQCEWCLGVGALFYMPEFKCWQPADDFSDGHEVLERWEHDERS